MCYGVLISCPRHLIAVGVSAIQEGLLGDRQAPATCPAFRRHFIDPFRTSHESAEFLPLGASIRKLLEGNSHLAGDRSGPGKATHLSNGTLAESLIINTGPRA